MAARATALVVAALLLAAGCSNGSDDAGRGAVPTTAPAVTATSATDAVAPATTRTTANVTDIPDDSTTPVATVTVTDTTPTGTTTPVTVGDTTPPVTGTTETVTSTTGSGPTVPTTLPPTTTTGPDDITDDTTTSTTEADTGDGTEPRNKVDEQYPIGSAARQAYLEASGGIAPAGATVTFDLGSGGFAHQSGRTTADRWPDGFPAPPGSLNYQTDHLERREATRAARWVAAMDRSGVGHYWLMQGSRAGFVPADPADPYYFVGVFNGAPETPGMTELREYAPRRWRNGAWVYLNPEKPRTRVIWSYPRWDACESWLASQRSDHAPQGKNTTSCELAVDWSVWVAEQYTDPALAGLSEYDRMGVVWHRYFTVIVGALAQAPATGDAFGDTVANRESGRMAEHLEFTLHNWLTVDHEVTGGARTDEYRRWKAEIDAGRHPWETAQ